MAQVTAKNQKETLFPELFKLVSESYSTLNLILGIYQGKISYGEQEDKRSLNNLSNELLDYRIEGTTHKIIVRWVYVLSSMKFVALHKEDGEDYLSETIKKNIDLYVTGFACQIYQYFVDEEKEKLIEKMVYDVTGQRLSEEEVS